MVDTPLSISYAVHVTSQPGVITQSNGFTEAPGSPWPAAVGFLGLQGSTSSQLLHGRDFLF